MTTVSEVITRAAELVSVANEGQPAPEAYFTINIAMSRFNTMMRSWFGHGLGLPLKRVWRASAGDRAVCGGLYGVNVYLPEYPEDGWRVGVVGARTLTSSTYTGTISGGANVTTTGDANFFFRADTGNWELERDLTLSDDIYFPVDVVDGLPPLLAVKVLPVGYPGSELLNGWAQVARQKIEQRYAPRPQSILDPALTWTRFGYDINRDA